MATAPVNILLLHTTLVIKSADGVTSAAAPQTHDSSALCFLSLFSLLQVPGLSTRQPCGMIQRSITVPSVPRSK